MAIADTAPTRPKDSIDVYLTLASYSSVNASSAPPSAVSPAPASLLIFYDWDELIKSLDKEFVKLLAWYGPLPKSWLVAYYELAWDWFPFESDWHEWLTAPTTATFVRDDGAPIEVSPRLIDALEDMPVDAAAQ